MSAKWLPIVVAVFAVGCSSAPSETATDGASSPLAEFLGEDSFTFGGDSDEAEARFAEEERGRQELIATCMREQGFEYTPVNFDDVSFFGGGEDGVEWGSDEWTAKYGLGISTLRFSQDSVGPNLVGNDFEASFGPSNDPNQARIEAMSESEQEAYYTALYGDTSAFEQDPTVADEESSDSGTIDQFELGGCQGEAYESDNSSRFFQDFQDELDDLYRRAQNDPRLIDAQQKVAECVIEKGHNFTNQQDLIDELEEGLNTIEQPINDQFAQVSEDDLANMSDEELNALFNTAPELSEESRAKLAELQEREVSVAVALNECDGDGEESEQLFQEVFAEYEQRFLDENSDRLADYQGGNTNG